SALQRRSLSLTTPSRLSRGSLRSLCCAGKKGKGGPSRQFPISQFRASVSLNQFFQCLTARDLTRIGGLHWKWCKWLLNNPCLCVHIDVHLSWRNAWQRSK